MTTPNYGRALFAGALLAVLGVLMFALIWIAMGSAGVANVPRLFTSMCIPPAIIGVLVGGYWMFVRKPAVVTPPPAEPTESNKKDDQPPLA